MRFRAVKLKPYEFNFAIIKSCGRQSNALERSVRRAPNTFPLSTAFFHFSVIAKRQCCTLYSFLNPHCYLERNLSIYIIICFRGNWKYTNETKRSILLATKIFKDNQKINKFEENI